MGILRESSSDIWEIHAKVGSVATIVHQSDLAQPRTTAVRLVVDSGSSRSCLSRTVCDSLNLETKGQWRLIGTTGEETVRFSRVTLTFPGSTLGPIPWLHVGRIQPHRLSEFHGVLGRDVLSKWELLYRGPNATLTIRDHLSLVGWLAS
jgi:hypothetical protein